MKKIFIVRDQLERIHFVTDSFKKCGKFISGAKPDNYRIDVFVLGQVVLFPDFSQFGHEKV